MPRIVLPETKVGHSFAITGPPGSGKTRLACAALRADPDRWGTKGCYIAVDSGSFLMDSVLAEDRKLFWERRILLGGEEGKPYDPYEELMDIATKPEYADCDTFVLDTATVASRQVLQSLANSGKFSDKHVVISSHKHGKLNMAMEGDYGAAQQCMFNIFSAFEGSGKNFIAIFHDGLLEPKPGKDGPTISGPATVGRGAIVPVAGWFHNLVRCEAKPVGAGATRSVEYWVHTEKKGVHLAKLRMRVPTNPISEFKLNPDPINFWQKVKEIQS